MAPSPIESLVASAGAAIETLQGHATNVRGLDAEARARLDNLPPPTDDDPSDVVKLRSKLRVMQRSLHGRLRGTLKSLEQMRGNVDTALLAHHRFKTAKDDGEKSEAAEEVQKISSDLDEILEDAEDDGLFAKLPEMPPGDDANQRLTDDTDEPKKESSTSEAAGILSQTDPFARLDALSGADRMSVDELKKLKSSRDALQKIIKFLKRTERDVDVSAKLAAEIKSLSIPGDGSVGSDEVTEDVQQYSSENFAYGTTSLNTWLAVVTACPELVEEMRKLARGYDGNNTVSPLEQKPHCCVFGSSLGWLVFYLALGQMVPCIGYEILEGRVEVANEAGDLLSDDDDNKFRDLFQFSVKDCNTVSLANVYICVLTSQCWDLSLKTKIAEHLALNLPKNALVADYGDFLKNAKEFGEPIKKVIAPTSWNDKQTFYVFKKK